MGRHTWGWDFYHGGGSAKFWKGGSIFLRGGGVKFFSPKRGVKGCVNFFFAKNVKNLPVLSDFNGFFSSFDDFLTGFSDFLTVFSASTMKNSPPQAQPKFKKF